MSPSRFSSILVATLLVPLSSLVHSQDPAALANCEAVSAALQKSVESAGSKARVLQLVEDAMISSEECACEIVKAAIVGSKADADLVGQIVRVAANAAPGMTPTIAECAMAVAPDAGGSIRVALEEVLVGNGPAPAVASNGETSYGKASVAPVSSTGKDVTSLASLDKEPVSDLAPATGDAFGPKAPVDIRGIYLIPPAVGGFSGETETVTRTVVREVPVTTGTVEAATVVAPYGGATTP